MSDACIDLMMMMIMNTIERLLCRADNQLSIYLHLKMVVVRNVDAGKIVAYVECGKRVASYISQWVTQTIDECRRYEFRRKMKFKLKIVCVSV